MRNVLAHELCEGTFKDKDIIEILSDEKIKDLQFEFLKNYDMDLMDDMIKTIISNYYYMRQIIEKTEDNLKRV